MTAADRNRARSPDEALRESPTANGRFEIRRRIVLTLRDRVDSAAPGWRSLPMPPRTAGLTCRPCSSSPPAPGPRRRRPTPPGDTFQHPLLPFLVLRHRVHEPVGRSPGRQPTFDRSPDAGPRKATPRLDHRAWITAPGSPRPGSVTRAGETRPSGSAAFLASVLVRPMTRRAVRADPSQCREPARRTARDRTTAELRMDIQAAVA